MQTTLHTAHDAKELLLSMGAQLVGSRFMGFDTPTSDWDYLLIGNESIIEQLQTFGFDIYPSDYDEYQTDIVTFCRFIDPITGVKVEAQLAANTALYMIMLNAYETLKQYTFLRYMPKSLRKTLFLYELYKVIKFDYQTIVIGDLSKEMILAGIENKVAFICQTAEVKTASQ